LWKFHAVHHSPEDLDAFHNILHPVELWVRYFMVGIPLNLIVQPNPDQHYFVFAFLSLQNQLTHMNVPLNFGRMGALLVDNRYHFLHHSSDPSDFNRNFGGMFTIFDRLFGTYKNPLAGPLPSTGLGNDRQPMRFRNYLFAKLPD
jgi:sterol desaturase/sphingolipid hydroxylase (fatty acid hydroxylase superfamily)